MLPGSWEEPPSSSQEFQISSLISAGPLLGGTVEGRYGGQI